MKKYLTLIVLFLTLPIAVSAQIGEHRNDHQMATAMRMHELGYVNVAYDKAQLKELLSSDLKPMKIIGNSASESLVKSIAEFIEE